MNQDPTKTIKNILPEIKNATLVVVTKNQPFKTVEKLIFSGATKDIGESRWQEFQNRFLIKTPPSTKTLYETCIENNIRLHFIGHLQTNKARDIVKHFDLIQSVDSIKLLEKINKEASLTGKIQKVLLEVNISKDPKKHGFKAEEVQMALSLPLQNIQINGLMTILAENLTEKQQLTQFEQLKALTTIYELKTVSMGMSGDYKLAIQAGANMIRLGSIIFNNFDFKTVLLLNKEDYKVSQSKQKHTNAN
ncbi:MAG: YggS family pyridoxal phosphate-dependent enzyme [Candidatus Peregrinibacteria bacterium]|nr:YggS family pyridoxal phosphate-dependent enzyme [Candidatus Peregrinibacteria bacterium]MDZ4245110.1 YggS family pyridoxal phosphate-dependent enzyme [Candidatus Gracilibacteria bacterium]